MTGCLTSRNLGDFRRILKGPAVFKVWDIATKVIGYIHVAKLVVSIYFWTPKLRKCLNLAKWPSFWWACPCDVLFRYPNFRERSTKISSRIESSWIHTSKMFVDKQTPMKLITERDCGVPSWPWACQVGPADPGCNTEILGENTRGGVIGPRCRWPVGDFSLRSVKLPLCFWNRFEEKKVATYRLYHSFWSHLQKKTPRKPFEIQPTKSQHEKPTPSK